MEGARIKDLAGPQRLCRNCGAALTGRYCSACGQRDLDENERRFGHLVRDALAAAVNLDGRFWRSFGALLFRPGKLSRDYIDGRRAHWLAPFTIFILVNLIYFFAPALTDFSLPFVDQVPGRLALQAEENVDELSPAYRAHLEQWRGQIHSPLTAPLVERRVAARDTARRHASDGARGYTMADYKQAYERINVDVSKILIGLHAPFMGLALTVLFIRKRLFYAEHFVAALHLFSFFILLQQILIGPAGFIARHWGGPWFLAVLRISLPLSLVLVAAYIVIALRRIYRAPWWWTAPAAVLFIVAVIVIHLLIFRPVQFLVIHALI